MEENETGFDLFVVSADFLRTGWVCSLSISFLMILHREANLFVGSVNYNQQN